MPYYQILAQNLTQSYLYFNGMKAECSINMLQKLLSTFHQKSLLHIFAQAWQCEQIKALSYKLLAVHQRLCMVQLAVCRNGIPQQTVNTGVKVWPAAP
jgi:hypothetical protein